MWWMSAFQQVKLLPELLFKPLKVNRKAPRARALSAVHCIRAPNVQHENRSRRVAQQRLFVLVVGWAIALGP